MLSVFRVLKIHGSDSDLSPESRKELSEFAQWVQNIGNGKLSSQSMAGETPASGEVSASSIYIPEDILLVPTSNNISAATDSVHGSFFLTVLA